MTVFIISGGTGEEDVGNLFLVPAKLEAEQDDSDSSSSESIFANLKDKFNRTITSIKQGIGGAVDKVKQKVKQKAEQKVKDRIVESPAPSAPVALAQVQAPAPPDPVVPQTVQQQEGVRSSVDRVKTKLNGTVAAATDKVKTKIGDTVVAAKDKVKAKVNGTVEAAKDKAKQKVKDKVKEKATKKLDPTGGHLPTILGVLAAIILGTIVLCVVCCCLCPFCLIYKKRNRGTVHNPNPDVSVMQPLQNQPQSYAPPPQGAPYPTQPAPYPAQPAPYPAQPGYPPQPYPPQPYPPQPYPDQPPMYTEKQPPPYNPTY